MPKHKIIIVTNTHDFRTPTRLWLWYQLMLYRVELRRSATDLSWRYALKRTAMWALYAVMMLVLVSLLDIDEITAMSKWLSETSREAGAYARDNSVNYFRGLVATISVEFIVLIRLSLYAIVLTGIGVAVFHFENRRRLRLLRYFGRCTRCGHPRLEDPNAPCIECGNTKPHEPIEHWYHPKHSTAEQRRRGKRMMTRRRAKRFGLAEA